MYSDNNPFGLQPQPICADIIKEKYLKGDETTAEELYERVASALASTEKEEYIEYYKQFFLANIRNGAIGAGRIMATAGTDINATLINCFVQPVGDAIQGTDENGLPGIYEALRQAAETMRRGGGVGYDFSALRPRGAYVKGTHSISSGPCPYIDVFDKSCATVESAGSRRGAQMGVLRIDHPDVLEFITAKRTPGRWNNFNVSVGITDGFMDALKTGSKWELVHAAVPSQDLIASGAYQRSDGMWVYSKIDAHTLWDTIMKSTYDFAEPGVLFLDNINRDNNLHYCEEIRATNPCVTGDTVILTDKGYKEIETLVNQQVNVWNGYEWSPVKVKLTGRNQEIKDVYFSDGSKLSCTPYHKFVLKDGERVQATSLEVGDQLVKHDFPVIQGEKSLSTKTAYTQGFYSGDGDAGVGKKRKRIWLYDQKTDLLDFLNVHTVSDQSVGNYRLMVTVQGNLREKTFVPSARYSVQTRLDWLAGLLDSDGSIQDGAFTIWSVEHDFLKKVKYLLNTLGVSGTVSLATEAGNKRMPDGKGGTKVYPTKECYRITINKFSAAKLVALGLNTHRVVHDAEAPPSRSAARFITVTNIVDRDELEDSVYCFNEKKNHTGVFNGVLTANCGEQPLPAYGCCDLGPIILTRFVKNPFGFGGQPEFDYDEFAKAVALQVRALDNVLDITFWPLQEQRDESASKRRIGVGFTGLGNTLAMLKLDYRSIEALDTATFIARTMRDTAYKASVALAEEKGAFPKFDSKKYLKTGTFASRLPSHIKTLIRKHGIRNSHLLSIAPTGTVSLAFADNASNGIEPPFSWTYTRNKRMADGSKLSYQVEDYSWRLYRHLGGDTDNLPSYFVSALEMSAQEHLAMMAHVQPYIDTAISKTVNIPADYPFENFKELYSEAHAAGLKGLATYRPNATLGAVLEVTVKPEAAPAATEIDAIDLTKVVIGKRPNKPLKALSDKIEYWTQDGKKTLYLITAFLTVEDGVGNSLERAIEFFAPVGQFGESQQWITSSMRLLSLAARGGFLEKALTDMRKVAWDRGPLRFGTMTKSDGSKVPVWHDSEVALIAYAIQNIITHQRDALEPSEDVIHEVPATGGTGKKCPECGAHSLIKKDGCSYCTSCGYLGSCG